VEEPLQSTQWGGPPDPRITEELGPEARLEACVYGPGPGNVPVSGNAGLVVGGLLDPESVEPAELTVGGKFIGDASLAGIYGGYFTLDAQTDCPLDGGWAAHRVSSPPATRWPTGFRPSGADRPECRLVHYIVPIHLNPGSVPQIIRHIKTATVVQHWPRILILNRPDADRRRSRLLRTVKPRPGEDREAPMSSLSLLEGWRAASDRRQGMPLRGFAALGPLSGHCLTARNPPAVMQRGEPGRSVRRGRGSCGGR
jgi:hypothetical protein